ncbi:MAG: sigma 54-interacting transcriptional regulator [Acidobacteriota bacterium]
MTTDIPDTNPKPLNVGEAKTLPGKLVVLAGPIKGAEIVLTGSPLTIGREAGNSITLPDLSVSRRHCSIETIEGGLVLRDLDSFNGCFVNGVPVKERPLEHNDRIAVGDSHFLVVLREEDELSSFSAVELEEGMTAVQETVQLRQEDSLYYRSKKVLADLPSSGRLARDLNALFVISTAISAIRTLDGLARELFEQISEVVPAESGAILLARDQTLDERLELANIFGWDRKAGADRPVQVSRTVVRQVLREGIAILSNDAPQATPFDAQASLIALKTRSLLAVPIVFGERRDGVIYLSTSDPASRFDERHLQLVAAIAGIAAVAIENVNRLEWLESENRRLAEEINIAHNMVGESARLREVCQLIARVAPSESTVLIYGESGTGKELAARAVHLNSSRAEKPFVAINCGALNEGLLESELFGYEKGAFTGAVTQKKGRLEVADGGTVFLDELGEMTPQLQVKLLRVLQEREFERVGGTKTVRTNIRLIGATNRDLEAMTKEGKFRKDLYFRLNVVALNMPPLRERREDIPLLAKYFLSKYADRCNRAIRGITAEAEKSLLDYDWPGNVRELENAIERAVVLGTSDRIRPEDLPEAVLDCARDEDVASGVSGTKFHEVIKETKKRTILDAIEQANGNVTEAAKLLGVHPNYLHRLLRNLNLRADLKK